MIVILIGAIMTALVVLILLRPLARTGEKRAVLIFSCCIPLATLGLYLWVGHPDLPSAAAMFEKTGPRAAARALVADELAQMRALSKDPGNIRLMLKLGGTQMKEGHIDEAIRVLELAHDRAPQDNDVRSELGAAYYAKAITLTLNGEKADAGPWLKKAIKTAPANASYRARLLKDLHAAH